MVECVVVCISCHRSMYRAWRRVRIEQVEQSALLLQRHHSLLCDSSWTAPVSHRTSHSSLFSTYVRSYIQQWLAGVFTFLQPIPLPTLSHTYRHTLTLQPPHNPPTPIPAAVSGVAATVAGQCRVGLRVAVCLRFVWYDELSGTSMAWRRKQWKRGDVPLEYVQGGKDGWRVERVQLSGRRRVRVEGRVRRRVVARLASSSVHIDTRGASRCLSRFIQLSY